MTENRPSPLGNVISIDDDGSKVTWSPSRPILSTASSERASPCHVRRTDPTSVSSSDSRVPDGASKNRQASDIQAMTLRGYATSCLGYIP
jgi:hypothetical protein